MSFGSVLGALVSQKNNKRTSSRPSGVLPGTGKVTQGIKSHREPTEEELSQLREKLIAYNRKRSRKILMISTLFLLILLVALLLILM